MTTAKKIVRKALGRHSRKQIKLLKPVNRYRVEALRGRVWEDTKSLQRERAFKRAQAAREKQLESIRLEKERQAKIAETRIKNLRKARKALAMKRNEL